MTAESSENITATPKPKLPFWAGLLIVALVAVVVVILGLLGTSIMERRWEAQRPALVLNEIAE